MRDKIVTFEEIEKKLEFDKDSILIIKKAYEYAKKEHEGMKRLTGVEYINHPLNVANILCDLNADDITIISALLHEVINNGSATIEDVEKNFGLEVANIVSSVSKINKLELSDESDYSAVYLRKILVGLSVDPRVLYVKLADRLHNMRTIWAVRSEKQKFKANETMRVLVPIAHRLGINTIKSELENICLKILKPDVYKDIEDRLNLMADDLNNNLNDMKENIVNLLNENGIDHKIKGRVKSVYSIYNKLNNGKKWNDIYDILALRVFVNTEEECYTVISLIHSKFKTVPKRYKDYIANPKANMYQSLHTTIIGNDNEYYEVQVRTYEMDEIAEKGIASHWSYKEKGVKKVQAIMEQKLEMFRNIIESNSEENDANFVNELSNDFLSDLIYVYTPKGDVIELPKGSTPIDFAYRIHSKVGDTMSGVIVNDHIEPISYELKNNDVIKVITSNTGSPKKDWLNIVKTPQARNKIKSYFSKQDREKYILKGKEILEKEIRRRKLSFANTLSDDNLNKVFKDLKIDNIDDLYLSVGSFRYTAGYIINLTEEDKREVDDILIEKIKPLSSFKNKNDIIIDGNTNILYSFAKCCRPVKGDLIVGFITKGEGVSIHKSNCVNVQNNKDRLIKAEWNMSTDSSYITEIKILVNNEINLNEFINEALKEKIPIMKIHNDDTSSGIISKINVKVRDLNELNHLKNTISKYKDLKVME